MKRKLFNFHKGNTRTLRIRYLRLIFKWRQTLAVNYVDPEQFIFPIIDKVLILIHSLFKSASIDERYCIACSLIADSTET